MEFLCVILSVCVLCGCGRFWKAQIKLEPVGEEDVGSEISRVDSVPGAHVLSAGHTGCPSSSCGF